MFKPKPRTFRQTIAAAVFKAVMVTAAFAFGFIIMGAGQTKVVMPEGEAGQVEVERPTAKGSPQWFVEKYDCWTGEAPADMQGKMPGHVIVTEANRTYRGGPAKVGTALAHIFEGAPTEIEEIHAFCR